MTIDTKYKRQTTNHQNIDQSAGKNVLIPGVVRFLFSILIICISSLGMATDYQSPKVLQQIALDYLTLQTTQSYGPDTEITLSPLDRRLRLTQCSTTPSAFLPTGAKLQGKLSVGLRCNGEKPWTIYTSAHIKNFANIIAAARPLSRGTEISQADLITIRQDLSQLRSGYFRKKNNLIGKILKRSMSSRQAFSANSVKPKLLVHRGDEVTILASTGELRVRMKGQALQDAARGDLVKVRNKQSKRIIQGTVVNFGIVSVQM